MIARLAFAIGLVVTAGPAAAQAERPGPVGPERGAYREQEWRIPVPRLSGGYELIHAYVYRPPGSQPRPLVVLSHGTSGRDADNRRLPHHWAERPASFFVREGFVVVVPIRMGHGRSPGIRDYRAGRCAMPDYYGAAQAIGREIDAAMRFMLQQSFVTAKVVLAGQSAGGWGSLALAASPGATSVVGIVNFAGGLRVRAPNAPTEDICLVERLFEASAEIGRRTQVPSIWLYSENDRTFPPAVSRQMYARYTAGGVRAEFHMLPAYGQDGHGFIRRIDAEEQWQPKVQRFLRALPSGARPVPNLRPFPDTSPREEPLGRPQGPEGGTPRQ